eukprot:289976_1
MSWDELAAFPEDITFSNLAMISRSTFVAVPNHTTGDGASADGIYAYYSNTNQWSIYWKYPKWLSIATDAITTDLEIKRLYLLNKACCCSINIIDLTSKTWLRTKEQKKDATLGIGSGSSTALINGELHVIGGKSNPRHLVYRNKEFGVIRRWKKMRGFYDHGLVYIKSRNTILLFGGTQWKGNVKSDT